VNLSSYETRAVTQKQQFEVRENSPTLSRSDNGCPASPPTTSLSETLLRLAILGLVILTLASRARACGPDFPNNLLDGGDEALLVAPLADFAGELERMNLPPGRFAYVSATNGYEQLTVEAELNDLAAALRKAKVPGEESARIIGEHRKHRQQLSEYREACEKWDSRQWLDADESERALRGPRPVLPGFNAVVGLPDEFADYFAGAVAMRNLDAQAAEARETWERLLARPAAERKFKSTWAAFMLGKSWEGEDDDKAVEYFQMVRDLARQRFADSTGLAVAAIGREAQVELRREQFQRALELYLEQYAAGDDSAVVSLQWAAAAALAAGGEGLAALAAAPKSRWVITVYLICDERGRRYVDSGAPLANPAVAWLAAMEAQNLRDVESAERLALVAYQEGEFEIAQRWVKRARSTPAAQWLQAKLFLRAGKVAAAAALLANVADLIPEIPTDENSERLPFADSLHVGYGVSDWNPASKQVLGELGVLRLSRREFTQALDALLRAGFWQDAAYVAERVLTTDELKAYVDEAWPRIESVASELAMTMTGSKATPSDPPREGIRYLLARRLTREMRSREARDYYPAVWQPKFEELVVALDEGWNESLPAEQRAKALFASAKIARTNGMELLGTELAPDWFIHGGDFDWGLTWEQRSNAAPSGKLNIASDAELNRATRHRADPEARFHYRYQAAFLAWEAAKLMPDNSDETARVLCTAGTWLKRRDPDTADIFYKALVRRCRKTAIGDQADRMRWFPVLDARGKPEPYRAEQKPSPPLEPVDEATDPSVEAVMTALGDFENRLPGEVATESQYLVHAGDSLARIASTGGDSGQPTTVKAILEANPGLNPGRLKVGQRILIPAPASRGEGAGESPD